MTTLDLQREGEALAGEIAGLPQLDPAERAAAIRTWQGRMVNEHISARVFGVLLGQAMAAGISARRQTELADFAAEELRHARRCAAMVVALGGEARAVLPALPGVPAHADVGPLQAFLRNAISVCCMSETVAVSLIRAETLEVGPPPVKALLESILADEVGHARFGWTLLHELEPLGDEMRQDLSLYAQVALRHLCHHELQHLPDHDGMGERAASVGVCSGRAARALFADTVETVIVPGLARVGIAARPGPVASATVSGYPQGA